MLFLIITEIILFVIVSNLVGLLVAKVLVSLAYKKDSKTTINNVTEKCS